MFKTNNRNTKTWKCEICHWCRSGVFIVNFEHNFTPCSSVSIVNFDQVNADWEHSKPISTKLNSSVSLGANIQILQKKCSRHRYTELHSTMEAYHSPFLRLSTCKKKSPFINSGDITDQTILADSILNYYNLITKLLPDIGFAQEKWCNIKTFIQIYSRQKSMNEWTDHTLYRSKKCCCFFFGEIKV